MLHKFLTKLTPKQRKILNVLACLSILLISFAVFMLRFTPAFQQPNFYAEDGKVYLDNLLTKNPLSAMLTGFNGYLVVGQYLLLYIAYIVTNLFGLSFASIAAVTAIISCAFLAFTVSLPFILFRKELGTIISLMVVSVSLFVPLFDWDYAIIGTVGNLKFAFLYVAFLFVLYRNIHFQSRVRTVISDLMILLCVVTNVAVVFILPFMIWPYRQKILKIINTRKINLKNSFGLLSSIIVLVVSGLYVMAALIKGVPKIVGYLDTPYREKATIIILDRISLYGVFHPITEHFNMLVSVALLAIILYIGLKDKRTRFVTIFGFWTLNVGAWLFVLNRPGISDYYVTYGHHGGPDQFFYASNLVFFFVLGWLAKDSFKKLKLDRKALVVSAFAAYMLVVVPISGSWGRLPVGYKEIGTSYQNVARECATGNDPVNLVLYPAPNWTWSVSRSVACDN